MNNFFNETIKSIVELSEGSSDKINLEKFMERLSHSFIFTPWNYWMGVKILKNPLDLMILQEMIFEKKPDTIIECGTAWGGSAYYMAHLMDLMNIDGKIITIDQEKFPLIPDPEIEYQLYQQHPVHPKIKYLHSNCLTAKIAKARYQNNVDS